MHRDLCQLYQAVGGMVKEMLVGLAKAIARGAAVYKRLAVSAATAAAKREVFAAFTGFVRLFRGLHKAQLFGTFVQCLERIGDEIA